MSKIKGVPTCKECKKKDKVEIGVYSDKKTGQILAKYWECTRCYCVVEKIFDKMDN
jgi:hypothetical protein